MLSEEINYSIKVTRLCLPGLGLQITDSSAIFAHYSNHTNHSPAKIFSLNYLITKQQHCPNL